MGNEERAEQTAPSFKPVIKAEGGGRGGEGGGGGRCSVGKKARRRGLVQDCHLAAWHA